MSHVDVCMIFCVLFYALGAYMGVRADRKPTTPQRNEGEK